MAHALAQGALQEELHQYRQGRLSGPRCVDILLRLRPLRCLGGARFGRIQSVEEVVEHQSGRRRLLNRGREPAYICLVGQDAGLDVFEHGLVAHHSKIAVVANGEGRSVEVSVVDDEAPVQEPPLVVTTRG